jgi:hypothetical protein
MCLMSVILVGLQDFISYVPFPLCYVYYSRTVKHADVNEH